MAVSVLDDAQRRFNAQVAQSLPPPVAEELSRHHTLVTYAEGSTLILQGSPADLVFWTISGVVKVYCLAPDGNRILVRLDGAGDILGYPTLGATGGMLQPFQAQALTKCTVAMLSRDTFIRAIQRLDQATFIQLVEHFNESWSLVAHRLVTFLGCSFRQRLEITFRDLASKFGIEDERGILLNLGLSHMDLAEMIGSSRPMATVLVGEMVADGTLYRQGHHQYLIPRSSSIFPLPQSASLRHIGRSKAALIFPSGRPRSAASLESDSIGHSHGNAVSKR